MKSATKDGHHAWPVGRPADGGLAFDGPLRLAMWPARFPVRPAQDTTTHLPGSVVETAADVPRRGGGRA